MSDFQTTLVARLKTDPALSALVGANVFPDAVGDGAQPPYVVWYEFANPKMQQINGPVAVNRWRIQFSCYGLTYSQALAVTRALESCLVSAPWPVTIEDERGYREPTSGLYRRDLDVRNSYA